MRKYLCLIFFLGFLIPGTTGLCEPLNEPLKMTLDFSLPAPEDSAHRRYLGLETLDAFLLHQIQAKILIIEIFSMYCPICQREAADVNKLFELIQTNPTLKDQVRLIGIGAGNSAYEVNFFKETYQIKFPLFSDAKFVIHKKNRRGWHPYFIGLKPDKNQGIEIFYSQSGEINDPKEFIETLVEASGLKL